MSDPAMAGENYVVPFKPTDTLSQEEAQDCLAYAVAFKFLGDRTSGMPPAMRDPLVRDIIMRIF